MRFRDGVTKWGWNRDVDDLFIRESYLKALQTIQPKNIDMVMIEGIPGIGKSLFIFYYIYRVVQDAMKRGERIPTFLIADSDGNGYFLRVDSNGKGIVHKPTTETPDYLITDTRARSNPSYRQKYIHVSSTNNVNVQDIRKLLMQAQKPKIRHTIYLPKFTLDEYLECDGVGESCDKVSWNIMSIVMHL